MITRELHQGWNMPDHDDHDDTVGVPVGDSEELTENGTRLDMSLFFFYSAVATVCFIILWRCFLKCRDTGRVDAEIPEPQATSPQGVEVVKQKSVGERTKELLAGFEEHKVQRVRNKLTIGKQNTFDMNDTRTSCNAFSFLDSFVHVFRK
jgi:hypothetical protein